jgi:RNA polymerase sigma factor (sigma-70 family)
MADARRGSVVKSIETLFRVGAVGGMADAELLELFLTRQDAAEAAFEALVRRHGPMVFGVCRGVLPDPNDADDAFQATFLVLARRASSVRRKGSIGSWLHGVARRVSMRAKADAFRRRLREQEAAERHPRHESIDNTLPDRARILNEELDRLPEKYRAPVLLCDAEGLTHESAARRLGWPVGTVSGRLSRAHGLLRDRLKRRGVEPGAIAVGAVAVPSSLAGVTARAAIQFASKGSVRGAAGAVPAGAIALAEGALKMMSITRIMVAGAVVMAGVGLTTTGAGVLAVRGQGAGDKPKAEATKEPVIKPMISIDGDPPDTGPKFVVNPPVPQFVVNPPVPLTHEPVMRDPPDTGPKFVVKAAPNPDVLKTIREAARIAETIPGPAAKITLLVSIAQAYVKAGDRDSARAAYQTSLRVLEDAKKQKAEELRSGGDGTLAASVFDGYENHLSRIAESQATHDFIEDAAETIKKLKPGYRVSRDQDLAEFSKALAQDGKIQAALKLAEDPDFKGLGFPFQAETPPNTFLLVEIAHIQAMDFPKSDRKWIDELTDPAVKSRVLLGVAAGLSGQAYQPSKYRPIGPR